MTNNNNKTVKELVKFVKEQHKINIQMRKEHAEMRKEHAEMRKQTAELHKLAVHAEKRLNLHYELLHAVRADQREDRQWLKNHEVRIKFLEEK